MINSASVFERQKLSEISSEYARKVVDINLIAQLVVCKEFERRWARPTLPGTTAKRGLTPLIGKIVNLVDVGAVKPWAEYSVYCASKAGLVGMTKSLAKELAPNITVNAVAPGVISWPDSEKEQMERQLAMVPMNRLGRAEEVAAAILFLLGNDYITGQVICVDGGRSI